MITKLDIPKWFEVVCVISNMKYKDCYVQNLARKSDITLHHISKVVNLLTEFDFVRKTPTQNKVYLQLTSDGKQLSETIFSLKQVLKK